VSEPNRPHDDNNANPATTTAPPNNMRTFTTTPLTTYPADATNAAPTAAGGQSHHTPYVAGASHSTETQSNPYRTNNHQHGRTPHPTTKPRDRTAQSTWPIRG